MSLPFVLHPRRIPVIVPRPEVREIAHADGHREYEAYQIRYLTSHSERGLFDFGAMLNIRQFAKTSPTEDFVMLALERRLSFSAKLDFPDLKETGLFIPVGRISDDLVWATISQGVIVTRNFTFLDLCLSGMALDNPDHLKQVIESSQKECPEAEANALLNRFQIFRPRRREEVSRAVQQLLRIGVLREIIDLGNFNYRAVFNPHLVASTRSGIRQGILKAEDVLRIDGSEIAYSISLEAARPPVERSGSNATGQRSYITRAAYQSMHDAERVKRIAAENKLAKAMTRISQYENNGCLTSDQLIILRQVIDEKALPNKLRNSMKVAFSSAHADLPTEIPNEVELKKDKNSA